MAWNELAADLRSLADYIGDGGDSWTASLRAFRLLEKYPLSDMSRMLDSVSLSARIDPESGETIFGWIDVFPPIEGLHEHCALTVQCLRRLELAVQRQLNARPPLTQPILSNLPVAEPLGSDPVEVSEKSPPALPTPQERAALAALLRQFATYFTGLDGPSSEGASSAVSRFNDSAWLTSSAVAYLCGLSKGHVSRLVREEPFVTRGARSTLRISATSVVAYLLKRRHDEVVRSAKHESDAEVVHKFRRANRGTGY